MLGMSRNGMQMPPLNIKKMDAAKSHLRPTWWRESQKAAGDGILIPQFSFHSDNKKIEKNT